MKEQEANIKVDFKRITLGNLLSMALIAISVFLAYSSIKSQMAVMQNDITWIKNVIGKHPGVLASTVENK